MSNNNFGRKLSYEQLIKLQNEHKNTYIGMEVNHATAQLVKQGFAEAYLTEEGEIRYKLGQLKPAWSIESKIGSISGEQIVNVEILPRKKKSSKTNVNLKIVVPKDTKQTEGRLESAAPTAA